jgi:hypothetical protein
MPGGCESEAAPRGDGWHARSPRTLQDIARIRALWSGLYPLASGTYGNFVAELGDDGVSRIYPSATLTRLATVKRAYDPGNLFDQNHNIRPSLA